ncbi:MAG: hypothetical protein ACRDOL_43470 [Streptosporangiaceae bacterium]
MAAMNLVPRDQQAAAAIRQQPMEKANAMCRPARNGPVVGCRECAHGESVQQQDRGEVRVGEVNREQLGFFG